MHTNQIQTCECQMLDSLFGNTPPKKVQALLYNYTSKHTHEWFHSPTSRYQLPEDEQWGLELLDPGQVQGRDNPRIRNRVKPPTATTNSIQYQPRMLPSQLDLHACTSAELPKVHLSDSSSLELCKSNRCCSSSSTLSKSTYGKNPVSDFH